MERRREKNRVIKMIADIWRGGKMVRVHREAEKKMHNKDVEGVQNVKVKKMIECKENKNKS